MTGSKEPNNKNVKRGIIGKYTDIFFQSSLPIISKNFCDSEPYDLTLPKVVS